MPINLRNLSSNAGRHQAVFSFLKFPDRFWGPPNLLSGVYRIYIEGIKLVFVKLLSHFYPVPRTRISATVSAVNISRRVGELACSVLIRSDQWQILTDVSKQPVGPIMTG